ncbi:MAG TPA: hypothetical protein VID24_12455 [Candidatus Eremiobacteraceae bacterium]|jgi:hypothetical protein
MSASRVLRRRVNFAIVFFAALIVVGCSANNTPTYFPAASEGLASQNVGSSPAPSLLVTVPATGQLAFVDPLSLQIQTLLGVPGNPADIVMHPTHQFAFLNVSGGTALQIVDLVHRKLASSISVPAGFDRFVFNADGDRIYAVNSTGTVSVVSIVSKSVLTQIVVGAQSGGIAYSQKYHKIYVSTPDTNSIAVLDAVTFKAGKPFHVGRCQHGGGTEPCEPHDLATSADGSFLLAASRFGEIVALDAQSGNVLGIMGRAERDTPQRRVRFFTIDPANNEIAAGDGACCNQIVWLVPTMPPFSSETELTEGHFPMFFVGVVFDGVGNAWGAEGAFAPRSGRVVGVPFSRGGLELVLGSAPGGIAYSP